MDLTYNNDQHRLYLEFTDGIGQRWIEVFEGDTEFYSAAYWDLLTAVWRADGPVRKTDALGFMTAIKSPHTAGKYIEKALSQGYLVEQDNPDDARSKLISMAPETRQRLDAFFDFVVGKWRIAILEVERRGPSPEIG